MQRIRNVHTGGFVRQGRLAHALMLCALSGLVMAIAACGELETMVEPEVVDLQLTLDTLRTQVRDAQRSLTEVRAELESRRQELADSQVARAQLEGRVREAERRVTEARHVIEVQREELLAARAERERIFRSSSQLHGELRQQQRKTAKPMTEAADMLAPTGASYQWSFGAPVPSATPAINAYAAKRTVTAASINQASPVGEILVKPGDTLWSLSRKYRIGLDRLRSINHLTDDQIEVGQILFLSEHRDLIGPSAETNP